MNPDDIEMDDGLPPDIEMDPEPAQPTARLAPAARLVPGETRTGQTWSKSGGQKADPADAGVLAEMTPFEGGPSLRVTQPLGVAGAVSDLPNVELSVPRDSLESAAYSFTGRQRPRARALENRNRSLQPALDRAAFADEVAEVRDDSITGTLYNPEGVGVGASQGLTFNMMDEVAAGGANFFGAGDYDELVGQYREGVREAEGLPGYAFGHFAGSALQTPFLPGASFTTGTGRVATGGAMGAASGYGASTDEDEMSNTLMGGAIGAGTAGILETPSLIPRARDAYNALRRQTANTRREAEVAEQAQREALARMQGQAARGELEEVPEVMARPTPQPLPERAPRLAPVPRPPELVGPQPRMPAPPQARPVPEAPMAPEASEEWTTLARRYFEPTDINRDIAANPELLAEASQVARRFLPDEFMSSEATNRAAVAMRTEGVTTIDAMDDLVQASVGTNDLNMMSALATVDNEIARIQSMPPAQQNLMAGQFRQLERFSDALATGTLTFTQAREIRNAARASGMHGIYASINDSIASALPADLSKEFLTANLQVRMSMNVRPPAAIGEQAGRIRQLTQWRDRASDIEAKNLAAEAKYQRDMAAATDAQQRWQIQRDYQMQRDARAADQAALDAEVASSRSAVRQSNTQANQEVTSANQARREVIQRNQSREQVGSEAEDATMARLRQAAAAEADQRAIAQVGPWDMAKQFTHNRGTGLVNKIEYMLNALPGVVSPRVRAILEQAQQRGSLPLVMWQLSSNPQFRQMMDAANEAIDNEQGESQ